MPELPIIVASTPPITAGSIDSSSASPESGDARLWLALAALLPLVLFARTVCRTAYGDFDSAEMATAIPLGGVPHAPGYPMYVLFSRLVCLFSTSNPALGANFASSLAGVAGAVLMFVLVLRLTRDPLAAVLASWTLTVSFTYWFMSTVAEVYVMQAAIELAILTSLAYGSVTGFVVCMGMSFANHPSSVLIVGPMLIWLAADEPMRRKALASWPKYLILFCSFALFYLYLPLANHTSTHPGFWVRELPIDLARPRDLWWYLSLKAYPAVLYKFELPFMASETGYLVACLLQDFSAFGVAMGLGGMLLLARQSAGAGATLFLAFAAQAGFYLGFTASDKFTMFCAAFALFAVGIGIAAAWLLERAGHRRTLAFVVLAILPATLGARHFAKVDKSGYQASREYATDALSRVEPNGLVIAGWQAATVLDYFASFEMKRSDVVVLHDGLALLGASLRAGIPIEDERTQWLVSGDLLRLARAGRPVYSGFGTPSLAGHFRREKAGLLFRCRPRDPPQLFDVCPSGWPAKAKASANGLDLADLVTEPPAARAGDIARLRYRWRLPGGEAALDQPVRTYLRRMKTDELLRLGHDEKQFQLHYAGMLRDPKRKAAPGNCLEEVLDFTLPPAGSETEIPPGVYGLDVSIRSGGRVAAGRIEVLPPGGEVARE